MALATPTTQATEAAVAFLVGAQHADGHWEDFRHRFPFDSIEVVSDAWATAFVGRALLAAGGPPQALERARSWLLGARRPAGWGFSAQTPCDADSTGTVALFLAEGHRAGLFPEPPPELAADLLVYWHPLADGFRTYVPRGPREREWLLGEGCSWCDVHASVSALVTLALLGVARDGDSALLEAAVARVASWQRTDGSWPTFWWTGALYGAYQGAALMHALARDDAVERAGAFARAVQRPDGGFGDDGGGESCAFYTALGLATFSLAGAEPGDPALDAAVQWLVDHQLPDGSWSSVPVLRDPRPDVHDPWNDPASALLIPALADGGRLFTTAAALAALARVPSNPPTRGGLVTSQPSLLERAPALSDSWLRSVVERATPLFERIHGPFDPVDSDDELIEQRLAEWRSVAANDDDAMMRRRLEWDDLDPETLRGALGSVRLRPDAALPRWAEIFRETLRDGLAEPDAPDRFLDPEHLEPFEEIFAPLVRVASRRLERIVGGFPEALDWVALANMERQLLHKLTYLCAQALDLEFSAFKARTMSPLGALLATSSTETPSRDTYLSFVAEMRSGGLVEFFDTYPVLARLVGIVVDFWTECWEEFHARLRDDLEGLRERFAKGEDPGRVARLTVGLSDAHNRGRTVVALEFESGLKVVYKPKGLATEAAFSALLDELTALGAPLPLRSLDVWDRGTYGWVEFAENDPLADRHAAARYYRRTGMLACLLYVLRGNDAHFENIIASGEHPVLIDAETLMHPEIHSVGVEGREALFQASRLIWRSVVRTGLLPRWEFLQDEQVVDTSAIGTTGQQISPIDLPVWRNVNTDQMTLEFEGWTIAPQANTPHLDGEIPPPSAFTDEILGGVEEMYRFLMANRERLLAPDGPIERFRGERLRFIYRGTWIYGFLLIRTLDPRYLRDGADRSIQLEALGRALLPATEKHVFWPLTAVERDDMERMDIPCFTYRSDDDGFEPAAGVRIDHCFLEPSIEAVRNHIATMNEEDLERQLSFARAALFTREAVATHLGSGGKRAPGDGDASVPLRPEDGVTEAIAIAEELRRKAVGSPDENLTWITVRLFARSQRYQLEPCSYDLYDGTGGIAVFLAGLARVTGDRSYERLARATIQMLRHHLAEDDDHELVATIGIGGATGLGSIVYALTTTASLLGDESLLADARLAAEQITPQRIADDRGLDVVGGSAGAILGLLRLHRETGDADPLERALACGEHLLAARVESPAGHLTWPLWQGQLLTGFSHGASGIAYALERLAVASGDERFREAAVEAIRYERSVYSPDHRNWPDYRQLPDIEEWPRYLNAWCHGAPGVGLARLGTLATLDDPELREDVEIAVSTARSESPGGVDHLCCGTVGRLELLLAAGLELDRPDWTEEAAQLANFVVTRAHARGSYYFDPPDGVLVPGLFVGIAGIGYELLRIGHHDVLPSVLLWE